MSLANLLLLVIPGAAPFVAQEWGDVKGRVLFVGDKIPENSKVNVTADKNKCLSKGPIYRNELVIDSKTKGVRWVMVWLAPVKDFRNIKADYLPVHPSLKKVPEEVVLRAPCCAFEPRAQAVRSGTTLVFNNRENVSHTLKFNSQNNGVACALLPPGKEHRVGPLAAERFPVSFFCTIHPWMKGWIHVVPHPYFAVTDAQGRFEIKDAPAGRWRLMLWQETSGYIPFRSKNDVGILIDVKPKKTTDVGAVKFVEQKD